LEFAIISIISIIIVSLCVGRETGESGGGDKLWDHRIHREFESLRGVMCVSP
jgi:hypothetical protein